VVTEVWPLFVHVISFRETVVREDQAGKAEQAAGVVKADPGPMADEAAL
jgi:hypothetical protein